MGPVSISSGSSPVTEKAWNRARGRSPSSRALLALAMRTAEAPSVSGDEFSGVIFQSRSGKRAANASVRNDGRG